MRTQIRIRLFQYYQTLFGNKKITDLENYQ